MLERDPHAALLSLAVDSGQSQFPIMPVLLSEIAAGNGSIQDPDAIQNMNILKVEIEREAKEENLKTPSKGSNKLLIKLLIRMPPF